MADPSSTICECSHPAVEFWCSTHGHAHRLCKYPTSKVSLQRECPRAIETQTINSKNHNHNKVPLLQLASQFAVLAADSIRMPWKVTSSLTSSTGVPIYATEIILNQIILSSKSWACSAQRICSANSTEQLCTCPPFQFISVVFCSTLQAWYDLVQDVTCR